MNSTEEPRIILTPVNGCARMDVTNIDRIDAFNMMAAAMESLTEDLVKLGLQTAAEMKAAISELATILCEDADHAAEAEEQEEEACERS